MAFISVQFFIFLPVVLLIYFIVPGRVKFFWGQQRQRLLLHRFFDMQQLKSGEHRFLAGKNNIGRRYPDNPLPPQGPFGQCKGHNQRQRNSYRTERLLSVWRKAYLWAELHSNLHQPLQVQRQGGANNRKP